MRKHWWVIVAACILVGMWLYLPFSPVTGAGAVDIDSSLASTEQSLFTLGGEGQQEESLRGAGAPGMSLTEGAGGRYARSAGGGTPESRLYQAPGGASGAPLTAEQAEKLKEDPDAAKSFADAMKSVAHSSEDGGWGGQAARTGFSRPRAEFAKAGSSRSGGTGSSSAQLVMKKPFGTGGDPGYNPLAGSPFSGGSSKGGRIAQNAEGSRSLQGLSRVKKQSMAALKGADESSANRNSQSFDEASGKSALDQLRSAGGGGRGAGVSDSGVPMNLKANDPDVVSKKKLEPPKIDDAGQVKDSDNQQYMQQMMMMMLMSAAMSGLMGSTGSMIGNMMMMTAQTQLQEDRVKSSSRLPDHDDFPLERVAKVRLA